ncbi:MAG: hypothetical protein EOM12_18235 [Verrucomicrobiae bacterium]|jgi:hypothetical protein|nr:hypothetical protein [Verrucomicrobiae bacterium]
MGRRHVSEEDRLREAAISLGKMDRVLEWRRPEETRVAPEGTIGHWTDGSEYRLVHVGNHCGEIDPGVMLLAMEGQFDNYILTKEKIPLIIDDIRRIDSIQALLLLVKKWGGLTDISSHPGLAIGNDMPRKECPRLDAWIRFVASVQMVLDLLERKDCSKYLFDRKDRPGKDLVWRGFPGSGYEEKPLHWVRITDYPDLQEGVEQEPPYHRLWVAELLQNGIKNSMLEKRYIVLPEFGQIVEMTRAHDLYGFVWLALEATVLEMSPSSDLRLRRCCYCDLWDLEDNGERLMRRTNDKTAWYHDLCKRREDRRTDLEQAALKKGREFIIRPGARKHGVLKT